MRNSPPTIPRILLIGPPGAGKSFLARLISERFNFPHLSTSDIVRANLAAATPLEDSTQKMLPQGSLVSDDLVLKIITTRLSAADCCAGFILDGFPRTLSQAKAFAIYENLRPNLVIYLNLRESLALERICGRWLHEPSGRIYHAQNIPPKVPGRDDVTGEPLIQHPNDTPAAGKKRLDVYYEQIYPLAAYYMDRSWARGEVKFLEINGSPSPTAVCSGLIRRWRWLKKFQRGK